MTNSNEAITDVIDVDDIVSVVKPPTPTNNDLTDEVDVDDPSSFVKSPVVEGPTLDAAETKESETEHQEEGDASGIPSVIDVDLEATPDMTESTIPDSTESTYGDEEETTETEVQRGDFEVAIVGGKPELANKFNANIDSGDMPEDSESTDDLEQAIQDDIEQAIRIEIEFGGEEEEEKEKEKAPAPKYLGFTKWDYILFLFNVLYLGILAIVIYVPPLLHPDTSSDPGEVAKDYYPLDDVIVFITFFCILSFVVTFGGYIIMWQYQSQLAPCSQWMGWLPTFGMCVTVSLMIVGAHECDVCKHMVDGR